MAIRTKRGAQRRYNAITRACYRDMQGGTCFGIDWPTLRTTFPERAKEIETLRAIYPTLPA